MEHRIAFVGFQHGHIFALYRRVNECSNCRITAICEENRETLLSAHPEIEVTHRDFDVMLKNTECDIVAIGDWFGKRGSLAIRALKAGKHVIADKPLCTSLNELAEIRRLALEKNMKVGCMYELREIPVIAEARRLILSGTIGKVTQIQFNAQHPLMRKTRPGWYFEEGKHGGTITDIGSHALDAIPWMTNSPLKRILAARSWKTQPDENGSLEDAGQMMLELENGCGVLGDLSYNSIDHGGYALPTYWRFNIWGTLGMMEFTFSGKEIQLYQKDNQEMRTVLPEESAPENYFQSFIAEIEGRKASLTTEDVLKSTELTLKIQTSGENQ